MPHDTDDVQTRKLLAQDPNRPWYRIENAAKTGERTRAKVVIFDAIGGWFGVRASEFVKEIDALDVDDIEVRLNSPGGAAFDGIAIMNALRAHPANIEIHVDGLAASAASVIAMGGDQVIMHRGATLMIHDASVIAWGPAAASTPDPDRAALRSPYRDSSWMAAKRARVRVATSARATASRPPAKTSSCACGGNMPAIHGCSPARLKIQHVALSPRPISRHTRHKVEGRMP